MDINCKKKIQSVKLNLQNGQVEIILRALELYKYNLNYMLDTEQCSDTERQEKLAMVQFTFEQVLSNSSRTGKWKKCRYRNNNIAIFKSNARK